MKRIIKRLACGAVLALFCSNTLSAQVRQFTDASIIEEMVIRLTAQTSEHTLIPEGAVPKFGTFWLSLGPNGKGGPPFPCPPGCMDLPIYQMENGHFLVDDSSIDYGAKHNQGMKMLASIPVPGDGSTNDPPPEPQQDTRRNAEKFMNHVFSLINTNAAGIGDTNLYDFCSSFPADTNLSPNLQIRKYGADAVVIKANHFDYSTETERDFALLITDAVDVPLWKAVDLFAHTSDSCRRCEWPSTSHVFKRFLGNRPDDGGANQCSTTCNGKSTEPGGSSPYAKRRYWSGVEAG